MRKALLSAGAGAMLALSITGTASATADLPPSPVVINKRPCGDVCDPPVMPNPAFWTELDAWLNRQQLKAMTTIDNVTTPGVRPDTTFNVPLDGPQNVPGPGDPDGSGSATLSVYPGQSTVCFSISASGIGGPGYLIHVHRGRAQTEHSTSPAINLAAEPLDTLGHASGCVRTVRRSIANEIVAHPEMFYINVHNIEHGGGALRGQLSTAYTPPRPLGRNCTEICLDGGAGTTPLG
jgi:hypothetical protein